MYEILKDYISEDRLKPYLKITDNNKDKAILLYELNLQYSSNLYILLSILEVALRNCINKLMIIDDENWLLNIHYYNNKILYNIKKTNTSSKKTIEYYVSFFKEQEKMITKTIDKLKEENKIINNNSILSNLVLGFWLRMFSKVYDTTFWHRKFCKIFNNQIKRGCIEKEINEFRRLRNRIAHNEVILTMHYTPKQYYDKIVKFIEIIDTKLSTWAKNQVSQDLFN